MDIITYNKKAFLLPESINSCALFHAKIKEDGTYMLRIHDCLTGIRLVGNVISPTDVEEAKAKLLALENGVREFREFIESNYSSK